MEMMSVEQLKAVEEQSDLGVNLLQNSLNKIRTATARLEIASKELHGLSLRPQGKKILVPLTGSLYVPGTLDVADKVLVDVGTGYFIEPWYGVLDMEGSAKNIVEAAIGTPADHSVILLAHNGPAGLGSEVNAICGRDWVLGGGDHGDPGGVCIANHAVPHTIGCFPGTCTKSWHMERALGR